jgi:hypothetical protein
MNVMANGIKKRAQTFRKLNIADHANHGISSNGKSVD